MYEIDGKTFKTEAEAMQYGMAVALRDPAHFAKVFFGEDLYGLQQQILRSVATNKSTAVKACHASGKTKTASMAALWWVSRFPDGVVVTTAPTWTQVEKLLWGEIHASLQQCRIPGLYPLPNLTELKMGPKNYAQGLSTDKGVRFQGWHGRILIILDEAPGVRPEVWDAIDGIRAGGDVRILAIGNPIEPTGPFYEIYTGKRIGYNPMTISAFDTPNLAGVSLDDLLSMSEDELDDNIRPYLVTRRWVKERYLEWGWDSPLFRSKVLGQFPDQSEDSLISLAWLEDAARTTLDDWILRNEDEFEIDADEAGDGKNASAKRKTDYLADGIRFGLDVAGPGEDETVLTIRKGPLILEQHAWQDPDPRGKVVAALAPFRDNVEKGMVDSVGIGHYMAMHLKDEGYRIIPVNVGAGVTKKSPKNKEKYKNLKAELFWGLRERFEQGDLIGLNFKGADVAKAQLAAIKYEHNSRGQIVIEDKDTMKKRGVKSPDRAESIMLAFADIPETRIRIGRV
jgi:hypothetical protein